MQQQSSPIYAGAQRSIRQCYHSNTKRLIAWWRPFAGFNFCNADAMQRVKRQPPVAPLFLPDLPHLCRMTREEKFMREAIALSKQGME
ncbi:MAG: hypothetical protein EOO14_26655, partial [Chitinophagaceae bacterium]